MLLDVVAKVIRAVKAELRAEALKVPGDEIRCVVARDRGDERAARRRCNRLPCARGEPGADGRLCPYREHALISRQEHEAWDVLIACQGQLRLAASGHVIGIDLDAALTIGSTRGCDLAVLSELLPAAEAGLVEALCQRGQPD